MRSIRYVLLAGSLSLTAMAAAVLLLYEDEISDARDSASRGSLVANTDAGQIEYAEAGSGFPLLSIHGAGGGFDQGLANAVELVGEGFESSRHRVSGICARKCPRTPLRPRRPTRMRPCFPS